MAKLAFRTSVSTFGPQRCSRPASSGSLQAFQRCPHAKATTPWFGLTIIPAPESPVLGLVRGSMVRSTSRGRSTPIEGRGRRRVELDRLPGHDPDRWTINQIDIQDCQKHVRVYGKLMLTRQSHYNILNSAGLPGSAARLPELELSTAV